MKCHRFAGSRILEAYHEPAGAAWEKHVASCGPCADAVDEIREVRRLYRPRIRENYNGRYNSRVLAALRRERTRKRLRPAVAMAAGIVVAALLLAGMGRTPSDAVAAEAGPAGAMIDDGLAEIRARIAEFERPEPAYIDAALDEMRRRMGNLTWDDESM